MGEKIKGFIKKHKLLLIIIAIIILSVGVFLFYETIYLDQVSKINLTLKGEKEIMLPLNQEYQEQGATASFRKKNLTKEIQIHSNLDNTKIGEYTVDYQVKYKKKKKTITRKVIVVDLEGSTRLYANQFDFYKAEVNKTDNRASNPATLTVNLIEEILEGKYPDRKTLIIDPVTDLLDCIEDVSAKKYEQMIGKKVGELNQLQKTKWYAYRREMARTVLNQLKDIPMNLILVARAKNVWDTKDGKMQPVGLTYDALDIVEYLMDIVIQLEKAGEETKAIVKKSRIGNLPKILDVKDYSSIEKALKAGSEKLAEEQE